MPQGLCRPGEFSSWYPGSPDSLGGEHKPVEFFDFAGFSKTGNEACFRNFCATELKHGRAAMMAVVDAVV